MDQRQHIRLQLRIQKIKDQIAALNDLRPGSLSRQYNVCGKSDCRCKAIPPKKHGPYYQLSYTWQKKSTSEFIRRENLPVVRQQLRNYRRLRRLVDAWIALEIQLARLTLAASARAGPARR
jgi:hypothetical protein